MFSYTLFLLLIVFVKIYNCQQIVQTQNGPIKGISQSSEILNKSYYAYLGIPYALPPVGNLRFEPPQPVNNWNMTLDCTTAKPKCLQASTFSTDAPQGSEDCLYLNVFVPASCIGTASCNSLVYIHGGSFTSGSASEVYPGHLIDKGIIVVAIQYRLAGLGFFTTCDSDYPGNMALKDARLALQWFNKNCAAFGGNVNKITLGGISAGAAIVGYMMQSETCRGLFQRAILQSGSTLDPWAISRYCSSNKTNFFEKIASSKNMSVDDVTISYLKTVDPSVIQKWSTAQNDFNQFTDFKNGLTFGPRLEEPSNSSIIVDKSYDILKNKEAPHHEITQVLFSFVSLEAQFSYPLVLLEILQTVLLADYNIPSKFVPTDVIISNPIKKLRVGREISQRYFPFPYTVTTAPLCSMFLPFFSFDLFVRGIIRHVQFLIENEVTTFLMRWAYVSKTQSPSCPGYVGHGTDNVFFVRSWQNMTDPTDKLYCQRMRNIMGNFIISGVPNTELNDPPFIAAGENSVNGGYNCYDVGPSIVQNKINLFKPDMDFYNTSVFPESEIQSFNTV